MSLSGRDCPLRVEALASFHDDKRGLLRGRNTIHVLEAEGLRLAHFGDLGHTPKGGILDDLRGLDAALIPVGGYYTIDAGTAKALVDELRPRVVLPMHYRWADKGYDVISEVTAFTALLDNVVRYDTSALDLTADTPAQTALLRYAHE